MLRDAINAAVKDAMKAKDERKLSTLRMVNAALKNADIEARGQGQGMRMAGRERGFHGNFGPASFDRLPSRRYVGAL